MFGTKHTKELHGKVRVVFRDPCNWRFSYMGQPALVRLDTEASPWLDLEKCVPKTGSFQRLAEITCRVDLGPTSQDPCRWRKLMPVGGDQPGPHQDNKFLPVKKVERLQTQFRELVS